MTTKQQIADVGWELEIYHYYNLKPDYCEYRAKQGNFYTIWRRSPEQVLADIRAIRQAREETDRAGKVPF